VYIEGALQTRKWTGNDGVEKYTTEVVLQGFNSALTMLDTRSSGGGGGEYDSPPSADEPDWGGSESSSSGGGPTDVVLDDEIPF